MATQRGICAECDQESLNEGRLVKHGGRQSEVCPGSGALMRNLVLDPDTATAAEHRGYQRGRQWAIDALRDEARLLEFLKDEDNDHLLYEDEAELHAAYLEALATQPTDTTET